MAVFLQSVPPDSKLQPSGSYPGHDLHGGLVTLSPHLRWLASCSPDGTLLLRAVGALVRFVCIPHFANVIWKIYFRLSVKLNDCKCIEKKPTFTRQCEVTTFPFIIWLAL